LLPSTAAEHKQVGLYDSTYRTYAAITAGVLLAGGGKSEAWAHKAIAALGETIPHSQTIMLPQLAHLSPLNNGSPREIAQHIKPFF
jgi:hypothetical protein